MLLFAKQYKVSLGREGEPLPNKPIFMLGPAVCCIVYTITSAIFIYALDIRTSGGALEFALIAGLGYLVCNTVNIAINPNIPRPLYYGVITGGYHMLGITTVSFIIVAMR